MGEGIKLLDESNSMLLIVDMQERLLKAIPERDNLIFNIAKLIEASNILNIKNIYSEQNPNKLGSTVKEIVQTGNSIIFDKMSFSCCGSKKLINFLEHEYIDTVVICGIESHVCVQQTSIDLIQLGYNVVIAVDAINSRNIYDHEIAIKRIENSGVIVSTTESIIFEWCKTADRVEFKNISEIIKKSI
tara:strand:+ start:60 stop:623 length:564 start_codon:yes stop_codon:yes gene_type:complete